MLRHSSNAPPHVFSSPLPRPLPLPVRLLVPRTRTWTTELLWLAPPVVCHEERAVVGNEGLLQLVLAVLVDVLLVVGDLEEAKSALYDFATVVVIAGLSIVLQEPQ